MSQRRAEDASTDSNICSLVLKLSELHRLISTSPEPTWRQLGHSESAHTDGCSSVRGELVLVQFYEENWFWFSSVRGELVLVPFYEENWFWFWFCSMRRTGSGSVL